RQLAAPPPRAVALRQLLRALAAARSRARLHRWLSLLQPYRARGDRPVQRASVGLFVPGGDGLARVPRGLLDPRDPDRLRGPPARVLEDRPGRDLPRRAPRAGHCPSPPERRPDPASAQTAAQIDRRSS